MQFMSHDCSLEFFNFIIFLFFFDHIGFMYIPVTTALSHCFIFLDKSNFLNNAKNNKTVLSFEKNMRINMQAGVSVLGYKRSIFEIVEYYFF